MHHFSFDLLKCLVLLILHFRYEKVLSNCLYIIYEAVCLFLVGGRLVQSKKTRIWRK